MALKKDFYIEVFKREQKWIELIDSKLLNGIYCKFSLQPFYLEMKKDLEQEYALTHNEIIGNIINIIGQIIEEIEVIYERFRNGMEVDVTSLKSLFLIAKMSNSYKQENQISKLQVQKQILEKAIENHNRTDITTEDYVYDDFPEEVKRVK